MEEAGFGKEVKASLLVSDWVTIGQVRWRFALLAVSFLILSCSHEKNVGQESSFDTVASYSVLGGIPDSTPYGILKSLFRSLPSVSILDSVSIGDYHCRFYTIDYEYTLVSCTNSHDSLLLKLSTYHGGFDIESIDTISQSIDFTVSESGSSHTDEYTCRLRVVDGRILPVRFVNNRRYYYTIRDQYEYWNCNLRFIDSLNWKEREVGAYEGDVLFSDHTSRYRLLSSLLPFSCTDQIYFDSLRITDSMSIPVHDTLCVLQLQARCYVYLNRRWYATWSEGENVRDLEYSGCYDVL